MRDFFVAPRAMSMNSANKTELLETGDLVQASWKEAPGTELAGDGDDLVGATLNGTYVVERHLGEGGMGTVYQARHTRITNKRVAVKVLHPELAGHVELLARFQREAETAASVSHPNVIAVLDVDRTPRGQPYLVCEYLEGLDLAAHLDAVHKLDTATALHVARQLCRGLAAAHAKGVIHRDLKPQNVFLCGDASGAIPERPHVKLLDFGLSRFVESPTSPMDNQLTKTGMIMGTPSFMAPEQAMGKKTDPRVDVYGVGVILYTTLTGRAPFEEESTAATVLAVIHKDPPRPRSLNPAIPPHVELVIERAMAKELSERYPDISSLERDLHEVQKRAIAPTGESQSPPDAAPGTTKMRRHAPTVIHDDVGAPRLRLVGYLVAGLALLVGAAAVAVPGLEEATGYTFAQRELGLFLLAIAGSSLTPALLWLRHIRRHVWSNSSRVLALLGHVRAAVLTFALTYGLGTLALHVNDACLVRLLGDRELSLVQAHWPGWDLLVPAAGIVLAAAAVLRRRLLAVERTWIRVLGAWVLSALAVAVVVAVVAVGNRWRDRTLRSFVLGTFGAWTAPAGPAGSAKPSDAKPSDAKPSDAKPSDAKPSDAKPSAGARSAP